LPERAALARRLGAYRQELTIRSLARLGEGDFCVAWLLNGRDVVRVPKHDRAARALAREACLLAAIGDALPVAVPQPETIECADGFVFAVHECLSGLELTRGLWRSRPEPIRGEIARTVGRLLDALHRLDPAIGASCGLDVIDHRADALSLRGRLAGVAGSSVPGPLREALDGRLGRYAAGGPEWSYEPRLLHADVSPGHVLVDADDGRVTGVIDWGDAAIGDPARDFIFLYEDWGVDFLELALDAYPEEPKERVRPRVHVLWLIDQLAWTLDAAAAGRDADLAAGIAALARGIHDD
jgi:aminoglycoside 2''-phosphotransferase